MLIPVYARQLFLLLMLLGLGSLLPLIFNQGVASAYHFKSSYYLHNWGGKSAVDEAQYRDALAAANKAYGLDNSSPHYRITLAKIMQWGVYSGFDTFSAEAFNGLYQGALTLRRNWPAAYSDYAYNLAFYQGVPADAFEQLRQGLHYGPFAPEVVEQTLTIGFANWAVISIEDKYFVFDMVKLAASMGHSTRRHLVTQSQFYNKSDVVCLYLTSAAALASKPLPESAINWFEHSLCGAS